MDSSTTDSNKKVLSLVTKAQEAKAQKESGYREALIALIPQELEHAEKVIMLCPSLRKIVFRGESYPEIAELIGVLEVAKTTLLMQLLGNSEDDD